MLDRLSRRMRKTLAAATHPGARISYSQCGEDSIISFIFEVKGIARPSYLDIGAHNPYRLSNTAMFYERGCRGINVEANPKLFDLFRKHRPHDTNLNVGIGAEEGEFDFYIMEDESLSTFSKEEADKLQAHGRKLKTIQTVKLRTIQNVLDEHNQGRFPDILSIDIEGKDFEVLRTIRYDDSPPKIICVEAAIFAPTGLNPRNHELIEFLANQDYVEYANTGINAIMVNRTFMN